ncbi:MAG: stage II sporulation protein R [Ruminococcaceae bacterium]|nr:stage II sporulation protein R [Oscillospiraceae bacterium]
MRRADTHGKNRLLPAELALLLALAVTAVWGAWSLQRQEALAQRLIRLHVVAASDDPSDQALKLRVRDRVLTLTEDLLAGAGDAGQARERLEAALPALEAAAAEALAEQGCGDDVTARLEQMSFPYREYGGFALPAGEYTALRLTIGTGEGQNWWCVVFPPLCTAAASEWDESAATAGMDDDDLSLMTEEDGGYVLKFRSLELWDLIRRWLGK